MTLKVMLTAEEFEAAEAEAQAFYTAGDDGKFYLDVDDVDLHPKVRGLRSTLEKFKEIGTNPSTIRRQIDGLVATVEAFGDLDPEDVKLKLAHLEEIDKDGKAGDVAQKVKDAQAAVREVLTKAHEKETEKITAERDRLTAVVERLVIKTAVDAQINSVDEDTGQPVVIPGLRSGARAVLMERKPRVLWDEKGDPFGVFENDSGEEVPIETYVQTWLRTGEAKHYLTPSGNDGTDTGGEHGKRRSGVVNPWLKDSFNLTEQGRLVKTNLSLAKQLATAAGVRLEL